MTTRHMIEREGLYFLDQFTAKTALNNLNSILETERHDSESIFFQTQSELDFHHPINSCFIQTKTQSIENLFDGTIFSISDSLREDPSEMLQNSQMIKSQNQELPTQTFPAINEIQNIVEKAVSENESDGYDQSSESSFDDGKKGKKIRKSSKKASSKKIDKEKNIFPNIAKRTAKIMFDDCRVLTENYLQKKNIKYADFASEYQSLMDSNCSGLSLSEYFMVLQGKEEMSKQFMKLFEKYLRKRYMVLAMKRGKMQDVKNYIDCKNRQLMYFSTYINSNFQGKE